MLTTHDILKSKLSITFYLSSVDLDLSEMRSSDVGLPASCSGSLNKVRPLHAANADGNTLRCAVVSV